MVIFYLNFPNHYHYVFVVANGNRAEFQEDTPVNVTANVGQSVVLECVVNGSQETPDINWTPLPNNSDVNRRGLGGLLTIEPVTIDNEGVYTCSFSQSYNGETVTGDRLYHLTVIG